MVKIVVAVTGMSGFWTFPHGLISFLVDVLDITVTKRGTVLY